MYSICIKCGDEKGEYYEKCDACGFEPKTDRELAKSAILSEGILIGAWQTGEVELPRDEDELTAIAEEIKRGKPYRFSEEAIQFVDNGLSDITWPKIIFYLLGLLTMLSLSIYYVFFR